MFAVWVQNGRIEVVRKFSWRLTIFKKKLILENSVRFYVEVRSEITGDSCKISVRNDIS